MYTYFFIRSSRQRYRWDIFVVYIYCLSGFRHHVAPYVADHCGIRFRSNFAALRRNFVLQLAKKKKNIDRHAISRCALFLDLLNRILVYISRRRQLFP